MPTDYEHPELDAAQTIFKILEPLEPKTRIRVLRAVSELLEIPKPTADEIEEPQSGTQQPDDRKLNQTAQTDVSQMTVREFIKSKNPQTLSQRLACLAYYLEHHDNLVDFTAKDLKKANTDARQREVGDMGRDLSFAARKGHLFIKSKKHAYRLSDLGEDVVKALPDKQSVNVITRHSNQTRGRKKVNKDAMLNNKE